MSDDSTKSGTHLEKVFLTGIAGIAGILYGRYK